MGISDQIVLSVNGGDGSNSYSRNSMYQVTHDHAPWNFLLPSHFYCLVKPAVTFSFVREIDKLK